MEDLKPVELATDKLLLVSPPVYVKAKSANAGDAPTNGVGQMLVEVDRQFQMEALCSLAFNCGTGALKNTGLARAVSLGADEARIRAEFERWVFANSRLMPGLLLRRKAEADMFFGHCQVLAAAVES